MDRADIELMHYGVKGMKWGRRRTDAQLAAAAKKREAASDDAKKVMDIKAKVGKKGDVSALSNDELKAVNERLNLEQQFTRMNVKPQTKGRTFITKMISEPKARRKTMENLESLGESRLAQAGKLVVGAAALGRSLEKL